MEKLHPIPRTEAKLAAVHPALRIDYKQRHRWVRHLTIAPSVEKNTPR